MFIDTPGHEAFTTLRKRGGSIADLAILVVDVHKGLQEQTKEAIEIIEDEYVDTEFGTGCLKITPAHDPNDKIIGDKHKLEVIDIFNDDATLNAHGLHYQGKDRFVVRKEIVAELEALGNLVKVEDYQNKVGTSERTGAIIEPKVSIQWFLKMKDLAEPALKAVMEDDVNLVPQKFKNTYRHWMENVRDWNISRQLWWGHRIPAFYYGDTHEDFVVAKTVEEAVILVKEKTGKNISISDLKQDEDALDTWFSSWLWPISVFDGIRNPENEEINYYYPTRDLVTAPEILFFWVARMIVAGFEYRGEKPFENVYLTGIVRDKLGRKMSKSLGNSPDPIALMNKYGADGVRVGMLLTSPAGNDLPFEEELCEQGRNFTSKIWNAFRLVKGWEVSDQIEQPLYAKQAIKWFDAKLDKVLRDLEKSYEGYRISESLMTTYKFIWDDFSSWYLEMVKPAYQKPIDVKTFEQTIINFEKIVKILHPFMPFITEEIWQLLGKRPKEEALIISPWPVLEEVEVKLVDAFEFASRVISGIRTIRKEKNIANKDAVALFVINNEKANLDFDVKLKWPNDIYVGGNKICGILIENIVRINKIKVCIVGIGLNVNQEIFPSEIINPTSIKSELKRSFDLDQVREDLCSYLEVRYKQLSGLDFELLNQDYEDGLLGRGEMKNYQIKGKRVEAKLVGVSNFGELVLESQDGPRIVCDFDQLQYVN